MQPSDPSSQAIRPPLRVYSNLCSAHLAMALQTYPTLLEMCREPIALIILNDGTLRAENTAALNARLPSIRVMGRDEQLERILPRLGRHPRCREYCRSEVFGIKLIGTGILAGGENFALCDADVLFLRPFRGIDRAIVPGESAGIVCMRAWFSAYSVSYAARHFGRHRIRLPHGVNAGFLFARGDAWDLDYLEWFLAIDAYRRTRWVIEQTAWAALAARSGGRYFASNEVALPCGAWTPEACRSDRPNRPVAIHFPGTFRDRMPLFLEPPSQTPNPGPIVQLQTHPMVYPSFLNDFVARIRHRILKRWPVRISGRWFAAKPSSPRPRALGEPI